MMRDGHSSHRFNLKAPVEVLIEDPRPGYMASCFGPVSPHNDGPVRAGYDVEVVFDSGQELSIPRLEPGPRKLRWHHDSAALLQLLEDRLQYAVPGLLLRNSN